MAVRAAGYLGSKIIHPCVLAREGNHFNESTVSFKFPVPGFDGSEFSTIVGQKCSNTSLL